MAKAVSSAGLDFVFIDTEHIPLERTEVVQMCQLYTALGISPVVRIPSVDPVRACQMLDSGAEGVVAPYIETTSQVKELAGAIKYRPLKGKVLEDLLEDPSSTPPELKIYLEHYNRNNLCILNIESMPAVENLVSLIAVPGVDAVFIGPHDLSVNLGIPEQYDHAAFEKEVKYIIKTCRSQNVPVGIHFSESPNRQLRWMTDGVNIVIHSSDFALFTQKLKHDIGSIKNRNGEQVSTEFGEIII